MKAPHSRLLFFEIGWKLEHPSLQGEQGRTLGLAQQVRVWLVADYDLCPPLSHYRLRAAFRHLSVGHLEDSYGNDVDGLGAGVLVIVFALAEQ